MIVEITLAPLVEAKLRERAEALGQDLQTFMLEAALEKADPPSFSDVLAPVHEETRRNGLAI